MAKTAFSAGDQSQGTKGTKVTAAFLNSVQNHRHDGKDQDGSCPLDYAVDTGAANAVAIALDPALTSHVPGLPIYFKAAADNTAATTIAINGLAAVAVKNMLGAALSAGDIAANQICAVIYDGAFYRLISSNLLKSRADGLYAPIGAVARAWVNFDGTGAIGTDMAIRKGMNVASVYKNNHGNYTINFETPLDDADYVVSAMATYGTYGFSTVSLHAGVAPTVNAFSILTGAETNQGTTFFFPENLSRVFVVVFD